jgi:hypothetical protein
MIGDASDDPLAPTRLTGWQWLRLIGNALNLTTPIGLLVARIGRARIRRGPRVWSSPRATGCRSRWQGPSPSAA